MFMKTYEYCKELLKCVIPDEIIISHPKEKLSNN